LLLAFRENFDKSGSRRLQSGNFFDYQTIQSSSNHLTLRHNDFVIKNSGKNRRAQSASIGHQSSSVATTVTEYGTGLHKALASYE